MRCSGYPPLTHLDRMTDSAGVIQHAVYNIPRRSSGYTTDDNARALRLCTRLCADPSDKSMIERVARYLSFLEHAQKPTGGFHNFMSYQRNWLDDRGCCDSQGQAVLALAEVRAGNLPQGFRILATELINNAIPVLESLTSLRAHAYVVQAWAILRRAAVADNESGGCHDGIESHGINRNPGAECTIAFLWTELIARDVCHRTNGTIIESPVPAGSPKHYEMAGAR